MFFWGSVVFLLLGTIFFWPFLVWDPWIISLAALWGVLVYAQQQTNFICFEHLSASIVCINIRLWSTIALLLIGWWGFSEILTIQQLVGIGLGLLTFVFLFDSKDTPQNPQARFYYGFGVLIFTILLIVVCNFLSKLGAESILSFLFFCALFLCLCWGVQQVLQRSIARVFDSKKELLLGAAYGGCIITCNWLYLKALTMAPLVVVYKIYSFEILVPILFSMVVYREPVSWRKLIAFGLTVGSILLMV